MCTYLVGRATLFQSDTSISQKHCKYTLICFLYNISFRLATSAAALLCLCGSNI